MYLSCTKEVKLQKDELLERSFNYNLSLLLLHTTCTHLLGLTFIYLTVVEIKYHLNMSCNYIIVSYYP